MVKLPAAMGLGKVVLVTNFGLDAWEEGGGGLRSSHGRVKREGILS